MKIKTLAIILCVLGQILIVAGFLMFRGACPDNILWLNIVVSSIVFWLFASNFIGPTPIELDNGSGSRGAGLGISLLTQIFYAIPAIGFMAVSGFMGYGDDGISFKWQLMVQCVLLFLLLLGLLSARGATEKAAQVYADEQRTMQGKREVRFALTNLADTAEAQPGVPAEVRTRLRTLANDCRFITPSHSPEAVAYDNRIYDAANALRPALSAYDMNSQRIAGLIDEISRQLQYRKRHVD